MATARQLSKPPIQEAVIDFQLAGAQIEREGLEQIILDLNRSDWTRKAISSFEATFGPTNAEQVNEFGLTESKSSFEGFALQDPDDRIFFQFRPDRVTVSHVKEYVSWDDLVAEAEQALTAYISIAKPTAIIRIAARYINRLRLPSNGFSSFEEILTRPPAAPIEGAFGKVTDFMHRDVIRNIEGGLIATVTIATVLPSPGEQARALLIDADVFKTCQTNPSFADVAEDLNRIREVKNRLFFGSILDSALEPYL